MTNQIILGNNLDVLREMPDESVDMISLDPPYFSGADYDICSSDGAELKAYTDSKMYWKKQSVDKEAIAHSAWRQVHQDPNYSEEDARRDIPIMIEEQEKRISKGSVHGFLDYMRPRLIEMNRVLKKNGSLFIQCDDHASHYLKVMMDDIFGHNNFVVEISWKRHSSHPNAKGFGRVLDSILVYAKNKSERKTYPVYVPFTNEYREKWYRPEEGTGRLYYDVPCTDTGGKRNTYEWKGNVRNWMHPKERMEQLEVEGNLYYSKSGLPYRKIYLDESPGRPLTNLWDDIHRVGKGNSEYLGFKTQKPEKLIERMILSCTNEDDIVLDPFMGTGSSLIAARRLNRKGIGIEISPMTCAIASKNHERYGYSFDAIDFIAKSEVEIFDNLTELLSLDGNRIEMIVRNHLNTFRGYQFTKPFDICDHGNVKCDGIHGNGIDKIVLEVKSNRQGIQVVRDLHKAMRDDRIRCFKGIIVAEDFGEGAYREADRIGDNFEIEFIRLEELIREGMTKTTEVTV